MVAPLETGVPLTLEFLSPREFKRPPGQLTWASAACPIPLYRLEHVALPPQPGNSTTYQFASFPARADMRLIVTPFDKPDQWVPLRMEADGRVRVDLTRR